MSSIPFGCQAMRSLFEPCHGQKEPLTTLVESSGILEILNLKRPTKGLNQAFSTSISTCISNISHDSVSLLYIPYDYDLTVGQKAKSSVIYATQFQQEQISKSNLIPPKLFDRNIFKANGTTADAAIATLFCVGVVVQESMGMGGGFILVYYDQNSKQSFVLDSREVAPGNAFRDMFGGDPDLSAFGKLFKVKERFNVYLKFISSFIFIFIFNKKDQCIEEQSGFKKFFYEEKSLKTFFYLKTFQ